MATKLPAFGWKEDKENALLNEDLELGAMHLENEDNKLTILIQPGKPTSRTRIVVQGENLEWMRATTNKVVLSALKQAVPMSR